MPRPNETAREYLERTLSDSPRAPVITTRAEARALFLKALREYPLPKTPPGATPAGR